MPDESDPVRAVIDTPSCPVCKDHYEPTRKPRMFVECGHDSCTQCIIDMKAAGRHRCPMCNVPVKMEPNLPIMWSIIGSGPSSRVPEVLRPGIKVKSEWTLSQVSLVMLTVLFAVAAFLPLLLLHFEGSKTSRILPCNDYGESTNGHACWTEHLPIPKPKPNPNNLCHTNTPLNTTRIVDKRCYDPLKPAHKLAIIRWYYLRQMHNSGDPRNFNYGIDQHYCFWEVVGTRLNERRLDLSWAHQVYGGMIDELPADVTEQARQLDAVCLIKILVNEVERRASWLQYEINCVKHAFTKQYPRYPEIRLDQHPFRAISGDYFGRVYGECIKHDKRLRHAAEVRQAQIDEYKAPHCDLMA